MPPDKAAAGAPGTARIRVLVVDDQRFIRIALRQIIEAEPDMCVVGEAPDGAQALALARELRPDAITMDVEMPQMDGLQACAAITREVSPRPAIIMVSAHTQEGAQAALQSLHCGAVDFVSKSSGLARTDLAQIVKELPPKLRAWARPRAVPAASRPAAAPAVADALPGRAIDLVVIAASTGGPQALTELLKAMGPVRLPLVVALHMPEFFTAGLAQMLSADTGCRVVEGAHGAPLEAGTVVLIPGGRDGMVARQPGGGYALRLVRVDSSVHPSGNALLESAAMVGLAPAGIVLTGMGEDGARGAAALQRRRAPVLVQSPASCVVDGMPCAALAAAPGARAVELAEMAVRLRAWSAGTTVTGG